MLSAWIGKLFFKKLLTTKYSFILIALSVGFFGWWYIGGINQDKLDLALELKDERRAKEIVNEQLEYKAAQTRQMESAVDAYSVALFSASNELDRVKAEHIKIEGQFNAIQFAKHFESWASGDVDHLAECMQSGFNQLLDNLEAATGNQVPAHKDPLSCATNDNAGDRTAVVTQAGG